jgi:hypothetical protein
MWSLETLGRQRLSRYFYMRDFLHSEIGSFYEIQNIPDDPDLALETGRMLCRELLDPMVETFGPIAVRSAYRSSDLNRFGNENKLNCARNDANYGHHIWDQLDRGMKGAGASIVVPWFADQYDAGRDWRDLAWWIHDHLPFSHLWFFPKLAAFNISWREVPKREISSYIAPKGKLLAAKARPQEPLEARRRRYADFPPFRGITYPSTGL